MIVVLAGGVGAARFLEGVVQVVPPADVTAIVNTGDDMTMHGLRICPDLDIVTCTLADLIDRQQGWGILGDTTECMTWLGKLGAPTWFKLGDRDLALHIRRTELLHAGVPLHQVADQFRRAFGVAITILPMSDQPVETHLQLADGEVHFEEYMVKRRMQGQIQAVRFAGIEQAQPAPGVLEAIYQADTVLIAPSNPIVSVGTILAVPGVRNALRETNARVVAVSPLVGGSAIKGPAVPLMEAAGFAATVHGVADCYHVLLDTFVIDVVDAAEAEALRQRGLEVIVTDTIMRGPEEKRALAATCLSLAPAL